jgi:cell division protein FtsW
MVGSASSVISMSMYGSPWSIFSKDLLWVSLGLVFFTISSRTDYHRWRKLTSLLLVASFVSLVVVLAPGIGASAGGASRWIGVGQFRFQPSEVMKLALALYGADILCRRIETRAPLKQMAMPLITVAGLAIMLVVAQPDLGTAMVLIVITGALFFAAGVQRMVMLKGAGCVTLFVTLAAFAMPYRRARLLSFINPGAKSDGSGYQVVQSLIGLGSGHLAGLGLGNSREKWGLLPNAHTDFIFSVVGEELGLIGCVVVIALVGVFAMKGIRAAEDAPDRYGTVLGVALISWISAEAVLNIGAVLGVLPVTGIPLPFISFGGSSLLITMAAAGMLVNIARQGATRPSSRKATTKQPQRTASRSRVAAGRPRSTARR